MNPQEDIDFEAIEIDRRVSAVTKAMDANQGSIHRWFWKGLIALNLVLWSFAFCVWFVVRFG